MVFQKGNKIGQTHGHSTRQGQSSTYMIWAAMMARCYNCNNKNYEDYIHIHVCDRWHDFENFLTDMGERPDELTLERTDNDGNYEPSNCIWASRTVQARNRVSTVLNLDKAIDISKKRLDGRTHQSIADEYGVSKSIVVHICTRKKWKEAMDIAIASLDHVGEIADNSTGDV